MRIAYFDCFAGASGDMILGALIDAGLSVDLLQRELAKLQIDPFELKADKVVKRGISGSQAVIRIASGHDHAHRHLRDIEAVICGSDLAESVQESSVRIFRRLATAEAEIHNTSIEKVHFHEVGAMDAIIDLVGAVIGLYLLEIESVYCSPLHIGSGTIACSHGTLPVPAPATLALVRDKPVYSTGVSGELLTPTGAAILSTLSLDFIPLPMMRVCQIGYGAGTADPEIPNLLRVVIGEHLSPPQIDTHRHHHLT